MACITKDSDSRDRTDDVILKENIDYEALMLPPHILKGLLKAGFFKPSPIQLKSIPLGRCGCDLIVQAKTGTGKTCVFAIVALENIVASNNLVQTIILAPTREIASQITEVIRTIGKYVKGLKVEYFVGGTPVAKDIEKSKRCHIAVGSPGRILHLIKNKHLNTELVRLIVFDEADKLMETIFYNDIHEIYKACPNSRQVIACSATYTPELVDFIGLYMQSGLHVTPTKDPETVLIGVKQFICILPRQTDKLTIMKNKERHLIHLISKIQFNQCLVFSNYSSRTQSICNLLQKEKWPATFINSRLTQEERFSAMNDLKSRVVRILVTTDLTARGIDAENVDLIINMELPLDSVTYLHRMGRAGRYGSYGMVVSIITDGEELSKFQTMLGVLDGSTFKISILPKHQINKDIITSSVNSFETLCLDKSAKMYVSSKNELISDIMNLNGNYQTNSNSYNQVFTSDKKETGAPVTLTNQSDEDCEIGSVPSRENHFDKHVSCKCRKLEFDPDCITEVTDETLYVINGEYNVSNDFFPVCRNKLPLNIPLVVSKGRLIRLQKNKSLNFDNNKFSYNNVSLSKCFNNIREVSNMESLKEQEIVKSLCEKSLEDNRTHIVKSTIQEINEKQIKLLKLCSIIKQYDLLGWLTVDEGSNLIENIQVENPEVIKLKVTKCLADKTHIELLKLGDLSNYLSLENEDIDDINTCISCAFDQTHIPAEFSNSFQAILSYFDSDRVSKKDHTEIIADNTKPIISDKKILKSKKKKYSKEQDADVCKIAVDNQHSVEVSYISDSENKPNENKSLKNNKRIKRSYKNCNSAHGERSKTVNEEVLCNNIYEKEKHISKKPTYLEEFEEWYSSVQVEKQRIAYEVYISSMFEDLV